MITPVKRPVVYRVYVRHNWGTDKVTVNQNKRSVECAGRTAKLRALANGLTGVVVVDVIPCKWVDGKVVETRKKRVTEARAVATRKGKARVSVRETRRVPG